MANYIFNIAKGRVAELAGRVDAGDPAACRLYVIVFNATGLPTQANGEVCDTIADFITAGAVEATNSGYARKELASGDLGPFAPDDATDTYKIDIADQTWTAVAAGSAWGGLVVAYAAVATPTTAQLTPLTHHDFAVTPDGSDITAQIATGGFYSAA